MTKLQNKYEIREDLLGIREQVEAVANYINKEIANNKLHKNKDKATTIAITAPYGGGKTFFAKKLEIKLKELQKEDKEITPVYMDLWKYSSQEPLFNIVAAILNLSIESKVKDSFKKIAAGLLSVIKLDNLDLAVANFIDFDKIKDKFINVLEKGREDIDNWQNILQKIAEKKKIIFLVDEIDRCNPKYAAEFLETIHHFFKVETITFVVFINNEYADKVVNSYKDYGVGITGFLQKFIDIFIPINFKNSHEDFITKNYHYSFSDDILNKIKQHVQEHKLSVRDIEQIIANLNYFHNYYDGIFNTDSDFHFFMYVIKLKYPNIFNDYISNMKFFHLRILYNKNIPNSLISYDRKIYFYDGIILFNSINRLDILIKNIFDYEDIYEKPYKNYKDSNISVRNLLRVMVLGIDILKLKITASDEKNIENYECKIQKLWLKSLTFVYGKETIKEEFLKATNQKSIFSSLGEKQY